MQQRGQQAPQGTWTVTVGLDVGDRYSHFYVIDVDPNMHRTPTRGVPFECGW